MTLVDSDVLIAHLRGEAAARDFLIERRRRGRLHASAVSVTEVTGGMRSGEREEVRRLLGRFVIHPVDQEIALRAGEFARRYRRSHTAIGLGDYLIAATADIRALDLGTLNVRHFPMFDDLEPAFTR